MRHEAPLLGTGERLVARGDRSDGSWRAALRIGLVGAVLSVATLTEAGPLRLAQLGPNGGAGPSYGYQPYNDRNPTGFYHPNGTGYGRYYLTQKHHAPRFRAFRYRKFRGT